MSDTGQTTPGIISWGALVIYGIGTVVARIIAILSWIGYQALNILNWTPLFLGVLLLGFVAFGWQNYHDELMESTEYGMRCVVRPVWVDTVTPVYTLFQRIYNPLICWWNAVNWIVFGIWREVVFPLATQCGIQQTIINFGQLLYVFADTFVADYIATGNFLTLANGIYDWTPLANAWITFWTSWQNILCCFCGDLCKFFRLQPLIIVLPVGILPNPLALFGSDQIGDFQFFCFWGNLFNALMNVVQQLFQILVYLISLVTNPMPGEFPRPDFRLFANLLCDGISCLVRSIENAAQLFVDCYLPFPFNFVEFFCIIDVAACIIIKTFDLLMRIFINIDKVVFHPTDTFYTTVIKVDMKEVLNLYAPLRYPPWQMSTTDPAVPIFGKKRLTDCLCIFIERLLCDPTATGTACFDPGAQEIIGDFDICCFFVEAITTIVDAVAGLGEWSFNIYSAEAFFRFIDTGSYLALDTLKLDLVALVDCLGKAFGIIPVVGWCLRGILTVSAKIVGCLIIFLVKFLISVLTVGFFVVNLMDENWLTTPGRALGEFETIMFMLAPHPSNNAIQNANTLANLICCVLNRIPIPPLPCTNCNPGGWIEEDGTPVKKADWGSGTKIRSMLDDEWNNDVNLSKLTPPLRYDNETKRGILGFNPIALRELIKNNLIERRRMGLPDNPLLDKNIDQFVNEKREEMMKRFNTRSSRSSSGSGDRTTSMADWSFRYQTAFKDHKNTSALTEFMPRGVTQIKRFDTKFTNQHLNDNGTMVGLDPRTGYFGKVDERIICMPTPTCFNLCCLFRNTLLATAQLLLLTARFFNGLVHGPTNGFEYFRGDDFEIDLRLTITAIVNILQCVCDFIELVFPIPNLDLCCPILKTGELINGILGVIINSIKSLALDPTFAYFTNGMFESDVDGLFNITLEIIVCLCDILRAILPIPGVDACCLPQTAMFVLIETARFVLQLIINLSTIETTGLDYFQNADLNEIGMIKQLDVILNLLFGIPGGQCSRFFQGGFHGGTGNGGIIACFCEILNLVIPARPCPGLPVGDPSCPSIGNCPFLDLCCLFREIGFVLSSMAKFTFRMLASFWQPWVGGRPVTFLDFLFCDENATPFIQIGFAFLPNPLYKASCGKIEPTLLAIQNLLADCPCAFFQYIDSILPGPGCFCGLNVGIFQAVPDFFVELIRQILRLLRNFWSPFYWNPPLQLCFGSPFGGGGRQCSWALSFFGPISDKLCTALIAFTCFLDNLLMIPCRATRQNLIGGIIVWSFEIVIRGIEIIEGIADVFAGTCNPIANSVGGIPGTSTACLAGAIEGLLALPIDLVLADALLPLGVNSQLDELLMGLPTCAGVKVSGIILNIARYLECTFFNIPFIGIGFGFAMHGLVIFLSILWQILRKLVFVFAAFLNLMISLLQLFSGANCSCWGPDRHQQGFGFAVGFCYRCLIDPCTDCGEPNGHGDCRGQPCCRSTEPAEPKVLCSLLGVVVSFFELVGALFGIFDPPPVIPDTVTAKRGNPTGPATEPDDRNKKKKEKEEEKKKNQTIRSNIPMSRHRETRFHERADHYKKPNAPGNTTDIFELVFEAIIGYDVSDCPTNPVKCICRNYPTHMKGICSWDYVHSVPVSEKLDRSHVYPNDVMHGMEKLCNGTSACDWFIRGCAKHGWSHMSDVDRLQWTECINKHTVGSRIHDLAPVFPPDFFTRQDGILQLMHNFRKSAIEIGKEEKLKWKDSTQTEEEKQRDRNNGKTDNEIYIDRFRQTTEYLKTENYRNPMIRDAMARLDLVEFKVRSGMLENKIKRAYWNIASGGYDIHLYPAIVTQKDAIVDLASFMWQTPWRAGILEGLRITGMIFTDIGNGARRFGQYVSTNGIWAANPISHYLERRAKWVKEQDPHREDSGLNRKNIVDAFYAGPVYKWWKSPWNNMRNPLRPFLDHIQRITRIARRPVKQKDIGNASINGKIVPTSMLNLDQRLSIVKNAIVKRWTPRWTPAITGEWERVMGVFYRMYNYIWPGTLHAGIQEKFIFNCNCAVADRTLALIVEVVDYCLNDFMFNLPPSKRKGSALEGYLNQTSHRRDGFLRSRDREWGHRTNSSIVWRQTNPLDPNSWVRPKIVHSSPYKQRDFASIPKNNWKRAITFTASVLNFYTIVFCYFEDLLGLNVSGDMAQFFLDLRDWFLNDNLNPDDCPDNVGFLYWLTFFFRCQFPDNLNGANPCAVGLKEALRITFIVSLIVFVGFSIFLPALLLPLTVVGAVLFYIILIPAAAWHYSPQCWLIFPSLPIPGLGITIPILPFPIGLPVLPEPLLDDVKALLDELFGPCPFENFRGIIPLCLYNGNTCPACPDRIDLANCVNVGIADGISNLIYLFQWVWPEGLDFVITMLGQTCILGGCFLPFLNIDFIANLRAEILAAGETQSCRQNWCFWSTIISIPLPLIVIAIVGGFAFVIAGLLFGLLWDLFFLVGILLVPVVSGDNSQYGFTTGNYYEELNEQSMYQSTLPMSAEMTPEMELNRRRRRRKKLRRRQRQNDPNLETDMQELRDINQQRRTNRDESRNVSFASATREIVKPYWNSFMRNIRSKDKIE